MGFPSGDHFRSKAASSGRKVSAGVTGSKWQDCSDRIHFRIDELPGILIWMEKLIFGITWMMPLVVWLTIYPNINGSEMKKLWCALESKGNCSKMLIQLRFLMLTLWLGSSPSVGSSKISISGWCNIAWANPTLCLYPLDNWYMHYILTSHKHNLFSHLWYDNI